MTEGSKPQYEQSKRKEFRTSNEIQGFGCLALDTKQRVSLNRKHLKATRIKQRFLAACGVHRGGAE